MMTCLSTCQECLAVHSRSKCHVQGDSLFNTHAQCRSVHVCVQIYCGFNIFVTGADLWQLKSVQYDTQRYKVGH